MIESSLEDFVPPVCVIPSEYSRPCLWMKVLRLPIQVTAIGIERDLGDLRRLDYAKVLAVAVFQGIRPIANYFIVINRISYEYGRVYNFQLALKISPQGP